MAILADLDRRGILRRTPDGHLPGPRAAAGIAAGSRPMTRPRRHGDRPRRRPVEPVRARQAGRADRRPAAARPRDRRRPAVRRRDPRRRGAGRRAVRPGGHASGPRPDTIRGPAGGPADRTPRGDRPDRPRDRWRHADPRRGRHRRDDRGARRRGRRRRRPRTRRSRPPAAHRPASRTGARGPRAASTPTVNVDCARSPRSSRPDVIPEASWRPLDPDAVTLRDIDTPADLR